MRTFGAIACGLLGAIALGYGVLLDTAIGVCDADCPAKGDQVWPFLVAGGVLWAVGAWLWGDRRR
jgi:hypothetical protein